MATIQERIEALNQAKDIIKQDLKDYVTNKSIDLNTRWDTFEKSDLGDSSYYVEEFNCHLGQKIVGQQESRYSTVCVFYALECLLDDKDYDENGPEVNLYKENVMKAFIKDWQFDW